MSSSYYARLAEHQKNFDESPWDESILLPAEHFWLEHQEWLESRGYMLRPRYRPGWVPSWKGTNKSPWLNCEDGQYKALGRLMDATRISDGATVALKKIFLTRNPDEVNTNLFFSSEPLASHPKNHCLPILEVLDIPEEDDIRLIVMPFVRPCTNPRFETIGEAVEFFRQVFEGLQFMHEHRVAHRDCNGSNIMMDATTIYPNGYHPVRLKMNRNFRGRAKHYTRTDRPPRYFLADFGLSRRFDSADRQPLALPVRGGDKTVPEFRGKGYAQLSDPFPTDIYYLGNMIKESFMDTNYGFEFMSTLVTDMTEEEPSKRPTIDQVVASYELVCQSLSASKLRSRVVRREPDLLGWWRSSVHFVRKMRYILQGIPPVPSVGFPHDGTNGPARGGGSDL